ncbi:MupG family TIM beta-alpha barrel fold protein [Natroniella sulfidigena]|uniref:MupG family TIM beta-alpha barrel fold protein n=1 Tax=Natroniella sulfidigena TaxID=723921 RepID=UPI00200A1856|nr:MupG family TIM beta-alpha barrel fold protein [Natroniella sulfidigena]MCK8817857.1 MupG family TIM beta-alpha barrel fold protein [Natroniella sulfidigena]
MIGISVFAGMESTLTENIEYIQQASELGINNLFTSLHIPEASEEFEAEMLELLNEASKLNMSIIADISKKYYERLELKDYKLDSLRLDFGFSKQEIAELTNSSDFSITLNASTLDRIQLEEILKAGGDLSKINACYNYYPRRETGMSEELFKERNRLFNQYGIKVIAFISSDYKTRGPIYEGLPTLEKHRGSDPLVAAQHLIKLGTDLVLVGDSRASDDELLRLARIKKDTVLLPIKAHTNLNEQERYLLKQTYTNRKDPGEFIIRAQEARGYKQGRILPNNTTERLKYSVTIDNQKYLRYEGDLQILKKNLTADPRVNVVADATEAAMLIEVLEPGDKFEFQIKEE